jgi:hypothetical protein
MSRPLRSLRLLRRTTESLDNLSGNSGEIFYDSDNRTLRVFTGSGNDRSILATRTWVNQTVTAGAFSRDYNDLINKPSLSAVATSGEYDDILNKPAFADVAFSGNYDDLLNVPELTTNLVNLGDVLIQEPLFSNQVLIWNGENWTNQDILSAQDTNTTYSVSVGTVSLGASLVLAGSDSTTDSVNLLAGDNIVIQRTDANNITITAAVGSLNINDLVDVDTSSTPPTSGQVLKWNGVAWAPGDDITTGGSGLNASTLGGFDGPYYLNYNNFSNLPSIPESILDLGIDDGAVSSVLTTNGSGTFTFSALPNQPSSILDLGISDGTVGQVLTTNGAGGFSFTTVSGGGAANTGDVLFAGTEITTVGNAAIDIEPNVSIQGTLEVYNQVTSITTDPPEIFSDTTITLNATDRVDVFGSPFKLASFNNTQRDLLVAENGDMIYNTTLNKFQGYQNNTWVNLDGTA